MKKYNFGFTLTELLITIAIVGILAAVTLPRYFQTEAARVSEATSVLSMIKLAEENFKDQNGCYASRGACASPPCGSCPTRIATFDQLGVETPSSAVALFGYTVTAGSSGGSFVFCAVATRNPIVGNPPAEFASKTICMDERGAYYGNHPSGPGYNNSTAGTSCATLC